MAEQKTITIGVLALQGAFEEHLRLLHEASLEIANHVNWIFIEVRTAADLERCDALIIPGGESTTMALVAARNGLLDPLRDFVKVQRRPVWGTCAGLILLAESANRTKRGGQDLLGGLDICISRNHFGRQAESFVADLELPFLNDDVHTAHRSSPFKGVFIRAPVVQRILPTDRDEQVEAEGVDSCVVAPFKKADTKHGLRLSHDQVHIMATLPRQATNVNIEDGSSKALEDDSSQSPGHTIVAVKQGNVFGTSFHPELSGDSRIHHWWIQDALTLIEKSREEVDR